MTYPDQGGCWFCEGDDCDAFCTEFDTFIHLQCLRDALASSSPDFVDLELEIIAEEFKELLEVEDA